MMRRIDEWVYDGNSNKTLTFNIASYSLKKALQKQVTKNYIGTGIFTEFARHLNETVVKKSKTFVQKRFLRGFAKADNPTDQQKVADLGLGFYS